MCGAGWAAAATQWLKNLYSADEVKEHIYKLAKKGLTPSKIGRPGRAGRAGCSCNAVNTPLPACLDVVPGTAVDMVDYICASANVCVLRGAVRSRIEKLTVFRGLTLNLPCIVLCNRHPGAMCRPRAGIVLRDSRGIANVNALAGNKVLRILKAKGECDARASTVLCLLLALSSVRRRCGIGCSFSDQYAPGEGCSGASNQ